MRSGSAVSCRGIGPLRLLAFEREHSQILEPAQLRWDRTPRASSPPAGAPRAASSHRVPRESDPSTGSDSRSSRVRLLTALNAAGMGASIRFWLRSSSSSVSNSPSQGSPPVPVSLLSERSRILRLAISVSAEGTLDAQFVAREVEHLELRQLR